ncbi:MAG: LacI family DNA-binding transcriptional regulator [Anaerolineae bacterium]|nr:LacI family DNA-binding transcriptional regulator [Anaerolineae bacterium]
MPARQTIEDIARAAQVSRGTVSRVLNNHPAVSADTRARVLATMEQLHYRPNFSARHMRTDSSNLFGFGLITDEVITTPFAVDIISGAQETLWQMGKVMLVVNAGYDTPMTEASLEALLERRVEGIVYAAMYHRQVDLPAQETQTPIVLVNCFDARQRYPAAVPDEVRGGYRATRALLERGHRRIGFINLGQPPVGGEPVAAATGRLAGYRQALAEYDVPFDAALVVYTQQTPASSYQCTLELLRRPQPPTALFCGNDRAAMACYAALASLGRRIPDDVAVIGFDNLKVIADSLYPPLTTVQLPHYEMGRWAVDYLLAASRDETAGPPALHLMDCPLVLRDSI